MSISKKKIIIGLVGEIASGKDTVALYLAKKYNSETFSFSQPLRDILDILYLSQTRKNMANLGIDLRGRFGQDILSKTVAQKASNSSKPIITLPNIRLPQDIKHFKNMPGFFLVNIKVDQKIRYQRLIKRSQNADDRSKTWQQFIADSKLPTEITIKKLAKQCQYTIDNNNSYQKLYQQIDNLIKKLKSSKQ